MAKVYPQLPTTTSNNSTTTSSCSSSFGKETYTIWTKSLICHGNGCTVFDSRGRVVYRVDNYGVKNSRQVYLMDLDGNVLFSLLKYSNRPKLMYFGRNNTRNSSGCWNGYKGTTPNDDYYEEMPWFQARKSSSSKRLLCQVILGSDHEGKENGYRIQGTNSDKKAAAGFDIRDSDDNLVGQVKRKESSCGGGGGVLLGDDVLSLVIEPHHDHSLIMALVIVYGLMTNIIL